MCTAAAGAAAVAGPAQLPLLTPAQALPLTRLVFTVDDSAAMQSQTLPSGGPYRLRGRAIAWPAPASVIDAAPGAPGPAERRVAPAEPGSGALFQRQFRSPDVNRAYYDPRVRYLPWRSPTGGRHPAIDPSRVPWDVRDPQGPTIDLRRASDAVAALWCIGPEECRAGARPFHPALVYRLRDGADPTRADAFEEFDLTVGSTFAKWAGADRPDCLAVDACTVEEELSNFANWFAYHRSRWLAQVAAASELLAAPPVPARIGLGSVDRLAAGLSVPVGDPGATHAARLLDGLQRMEPTGARPLHGALEAVGRAFRDPGPTGPWPSGTRGAEEAVCLRAAHLLVAAGAPTDTGRAPNLDGSDGPAHASGAGVPSRYRARRPYADDRAGTLADSAMRDYVEDLRPTVPDRVVPIEADPANWQHLSVSTIAFGIDGALDPRRDLAALTSGQASWGAVAADDLWHAALDTGGRHRRVPAAADLGQAMATLYSEAVSALPPSGAAWAQSRETGAPARRVAAVYRADAWAGDLVAFERNGPPGSPEVPLWRASEALPEPSGRNLWTWDHAAGRADRFDWPQLSRTTRLRLGDAASEALVGWLRGQAQPGFRRRLGPLGDIVDSAPVWIGDGFDGGYGALGGDAGATYAAHLEAQRRRPALVAAGSNDGFLHLFRASDGVEVFAYAPDAVLPGLADLASPDYGSPARPHRFFVDGPLVQGDAYVATQGASARWQRMLVGTLGAGGPGLFAIDIDLPERLDGAHVRWDLGAASDPDIGHLYNEPVIGVLPGGRWKVFAGNGAYSAAGRAVLLVIDVATGAVDKVVLDAAAAPTGLMGVHAVRNPAGEVIGIYGGDLRGQVWRVDLPSSAPAQWRVAYGGQPLHTVTSGGASVSITAAPLAVPHPVRGQLVLVGTGRLLEEGDLVPPAGTSAAVVALWDAAPFDAPTDPAPPIAASQLLRQVVQPATAGEGIFDIGDSAIDWSVHRGWRLDLGPLGAGQRVLQPPQAFGDFVAIETVAPGRAGGGCGDGLPHGFRMLVKGANGGQHFEPVFDTNGDGQVGAGDRPSAVMPRGVALGRGGASLLPAGTLSREERAAGVRQRGAFMAADGRPLAFRTYCLAARCGPRVVDRTWRTVLDPLRDGRP